MICFVGRMDVFVQLSEYSSKRQSGQDDGLSTRKTRLWSGNSATTDTLPKNIDQEM